MTSGRFACTTAVLSMSLALPACDKVTSAQVVMDAGFPVGVECVEQARQYLGPVDRFDHPPSPASVNGEQFVVQRGFSSVHVTLDGNAPNTVSVGFSWLGRAPAEDEERRLRLLEDVQSAVMQACKLGEPQTKITRTCVGARRCKEWLAGK